MLKVKFLFAMVLTAAVCLTACKKDTELTDDFTTTDSKNELEHLTEKNVTAVQKTDGLPEIVFNPNGVNEYENTDDTDDAEEERVIGARQYFMERGFKDFYVPYRGSEDYGLTLDMNDFKYNSDPFDGIDREHFEKIYYLTFENVDNCAFGFLSRFEHYVDITVMDYSGNADFSQINDSITLDNYMGGDLSTIKPDQQYRSLTIKNYSGEYPLKGMDECGISYIYFDNYAEDVDFSFLADCPNITGAGFEGKSIQAEVLAELLKNSNINVMNITVEDFSLEDSDMLIKAAGSKRIRYELDGSEWNYQVLPTEGLAFYTSLNVVPDYPEEKWVCRTDTANSRYDRYRYDGEQFGLWGHNSSLVCRFSNFTDQAKTAGFVSIFKDGGVQLTPIKFADGSTEKKIDFTVQANGNSDFDINEEIFDFGSCEAGIYKVVFDFDGDKYEQMFFIEPAYNSGNYMDVNGYKYKDYEKINLDFLSDEQNEIFRKAYDVTQKYFGTSLHMTQGYIDEHTTEDFLAPILEAYTYDYAYSLSLGRYIDENGALIPGEGDRGGDITLQGNFFMPIYSDENEVTFKVTVINGHEDDQYHVWFTERNFHMVKTDEGWRFDLFGWWY